MLKSDKEFFCVIERCSEWYAIRARIVQRNVVREGVTPCWALYYIFESSPYSSKNEAILWFVATHPEEHLYEVIDGKKPLSIYAVSKENLLKMFKEVEI